MTDIPVDPPLTPAERDAKPLAGHIRFPVEPRDVPPEKAARRLHLTLAEFTAKLPALMDRGFPGPDPTTGMFDLEAIDLWRHARHAHLFALRRLTAAPGLRDSHEVIDERIRKLAGG
jgi:hypothetical protein